jgi:hypothetical protein
MVMFTVACSTAWVTQAEEIVAAVLPAITNIITLVGLAEGNVSAKDLSIITNSAAQANTALQTVGTLIDQYNAAPAEQKAGILAQINTAISTAQANIASILPQLHITDPASQQKVVAIIGVVQEEIASLQGLLPLIKTGHMNKAAFLAKTMDAKHFRSRYNAALSAKSGNDVLDKGANKLKLGGHPWTINPWFMR